MKSEYIFYDASGFQWCWDGERVYLVAAELEMPYKQNGYPASTLEKAIEMLMEDGDMEKE